MLLSIITVILLVIWLILWNLNYPEFRLIIDAIFMGIWLILWNRDRWRKLPLAEDRLLLVRYNGLNYMGLFNGTYIEFYDFDKAAVSTVRLGPGEIDEDIRWKYVGKTVAWSSM